MAATAPALTLSVAELTALRLFAARPGGRERLHHLIRLVHDVVEVLRDQGDDDDEIRELLTGHAHDQRWKDEVQYLALRGLIRLVLEAGAAG